MAKENPSQPAQTDRSGLVRCRVCEESMATSALISPRDVRSKVFSGSLPRG